MPAKANEADAEADGVDTKAYEAEAEADEANEAIVAD